jgi:CHAD domain-containing protein
MAQAPQDHTEVEWQFAALDVRPIARWLEGTAIPGYSVTAAGTKALRDTYFDTADWRLHRAGFTCRVRDKKDGPELTLKSMAEAKDGVRSRREMTEPVETSEPAALRAAPGPCGEAVRSVAGRHELAPLFTLNQVRRVYRLDDDEGEVAEIAVDETSIPVGVEDVPVKLARVEVEVVEGGFDRARRFVDVLVAACGLQPAGTSKFEAALLATGQHPELPLQLGVTGVREGMTVGEVAFAVMRKHFGAFLANEAGTRLGEDIEALHDMRVAARRLRAAMQAFRPFLPPRIQRFRDELGWVARALGDVRDLDVQLERMPEWRAGFDEARAHALDGIEALLQSRRETARRRMLATLDSRRCELLVERFAAVLQRGIPRSFAPGRQPILAVAPDLLEKRYRQVRKRGDAITRASPASEYHLLRIDAKKLRYALEFVGPIYGKQASEFTARVTALQDVLGLHQDADVAVAGLHAMAHDAGKRLGPLTLLAMGAIAERYQQHAAELRRQFPKAYRELRGREWQRLVKQLEARRVPREPLPARTNGVARMAPQRDA